MNPHEAAEAVADTRSFAVLAPWKRILILASGSVANHLVAIAALTVLYIAGTSVPIAMTIGTVEPGSSAARAQLRPGDKIVSLNGIVLDSWDDLNELFKTTVPPIRLLILRQGEPIQVELKFDPSDPSSLSLGVTQQYIFRRHGFADAVGLGFHRANQFAVVGFSTAVKWLRGQRGIDLMTLGVLSPAAGENFGLDAFLQMLAGISVGLGAFNLLPIPALDGGRLLFVIIESVTGKPVNPKLETVLHTIGFLALLSLLLLLVYRDLHRFFG
jgi:regulator of sigma E protease